MNTSLQKLTIFVSSNSNNQKKNFLNSLEDEILIN